MPSQAKSANTFTQTMNRSRSLRNPLWVCGLERRLSRRDRLRPLGRLGGMSRWSRLGRPGDLRRLGWRCRLCRRARSTRGLANHHHLGRACGRLQGVAGQRHPTAPDGSVVGQFGGRRLALAGGSHDVDASRAKALRFALQGGQIGAVQLVGLAVDLTGGQRAPFHGRGASGQPCQDKRGRCRPDDVHVAQTRLNALPARHQARSPTQRRWRR